MTKSQIAMKSQSSMTNARTIERRPRAKCGCALSIGHWKLDRSPVSATEEPPHASMIDMDINLLVLNLGNTRLAIGAFVAGKLESVSRIPLENRADWQDKIKEAWTLIADADSPAIAGASVNPTMLEAVEHAASQTTGTSVQWVGRDLDLPIEVKTDAPKETGVDRVLNVAAAYEQMGKACVVADAGSALTVDVCDDTGAFLGGAIAPGAGMMLKALHERTAKLPLVALDNPKSPGIGRDTQQAILQR